jgi:hypothetical protein
VCAEPGCDKMSQGASGRCKAHGGGRRCEEPGCDKSSQGASGRCKVHGGGRRCDFADCGKSAAGPSNRCVAHGGAALGWSLDSALTTTNTKVAPSPFRCSRDTHFRWPSLRRGRLPQGGPGLARQMQSSRGGAPLRRTGVREGLARRHRSLQTAWCGVPPTHLRNSFSFFFSFSVCHCFLVGGCLLAALCFLRYWNAVSWVFCGCRG